MLDLNIILLNYNTKQLTIDCIKSILDKKWNIKYQIILVDNASTDDSIEQIRKKFPKVTIIQNEFNEGFAIGNNLALKKYYKDAKYSLLLNTDTLVLDGSLDKLFEYAENTSMGIVSCKLLFANKAFQPNCGDLPTFLPTFLWLSGLDGFIDKLLLVPTYHQENKKYYTKSREIGWVSGSVMLISQKVISKVGFLDEKIFMYGEDVDYCWRASKLGFKIGWTPDSEIIHLGGGSSKEPKYKQWLGELRGILYLYNKYYGSLAKIMLKVLIYLFTVVRVIAFLLVGRKEYALTYAKIIISL